MILKRILSIISIFAIVLATSTNMSVLAAQYILPEKLKVSLISNNTVVADDIKCVVRSADLDRKSSGVEEESDYIVDRMRLTMDGSIAKIEMKIDEKTIEFRPRLYRSEIVHNSGNTIFGIDFTPSFNFRLTRFTVEDNTEAFNDTYFHKYISGIAKVSLAFYDLDNDKNYYVQFDVDGLDIPNIQEEADMALYELANFSAIPYEKIEEDFRSLDMECENELTVSSENSIDFQNFRTDYDFQNDFKELEDSEDSKAIDLLREYSKDEHANSSFQLTSLVPNIPDYLYKSRKYGWEHKRTGYVTEGTNAYRDIGYYIYHMPAIDSNNVLNYVMRYEAIANHNTSSQQFVHSFKITHNLWIQYIASSKKIFIFDDRPWNARVEVSVKNHVKTDTKKGYFTHFQTSSVSYGSFLEKVIRTIIGFVPKLDKVAILYEKFESGTKIVTGSWHPTDRYAKVVQIEMNGLIRPGDHITVTGLGTGIRRASSGYKCSVKAK